MKQTKSFRTNENFCKIKYLNKIFYSKIQKFCGVRVIDLLIRFPTGFIIRNYVSDKLDDQYLKKFISLDLKIVDIIENKFNQ